MQAELGQDTLDAARADGVAGLPEFLGDDIGRSFWIQKPIAHDLLEDLTSPAVVGFGATFLIEQSQGAFLLEGLAELEVALFAEAKLLGSGQGTEPFAFAFIEHGQLGQDRIGHWGLEATGRSGEGQGLFGGIKHEPNLGESGERVQ